MQWKTSLKHMGTMAYKGTIKPKAISKITLVKLDTFLSVIVDPAICIDNFTFMKEKYELYTRIMMGEKIRWNTFKKNDIYLKAIWEGREKYEKQMKEAFKEEMRNLKVEVIKL